MSKLIERLSLIAIWLLGGVLASVLLARIWPGVRLLARGGAPDDDWAWPKTLQVYPSHPGDPVKLVRITKDGKEIVPGTYRMPQIAQRFDEDADAVREWLSHVSFTLRSQTSKSIVSVGIAVVFPGRDTSLQCVSITAPEAWCDAHPHWCDGGCPELIHNTLHWGLIPGLAASGLEARYRAEATGHFVGSFPLQGQEPLRLAPGEEITLSAADRADGVMSFTDPRKPFSNVVNMVLFVEGIDEAKDIAPCADRANSKTGCAFAGVSKFNIGIDVVYFQDGTIWGNYGYGYALPNPDGIFTRVDAHHFPVVVRPALTD